MCRGGTELQLLSFDSLINIHLLFAEIFKHVVTDLRGKRLLFALFIIEDVPALAIECIVAAQDPAENMVTHKDVMKLYSKL